MTSRGEPVVQVVRTRWTEASRGAAAATIRNAAPIAFLLTATTGPFVHEIVMSECDDFKPLAESRRDLPAEEEVELRLTEKGLRVRLVASVWGMPRRHRRPPAVVLKRVCQIFCVRGSG